MPTNITQSVLSTEPVQQQVSGITAQGEPYDPTSDPVFIAFIPFTLPPSSPQPGDWMTATWETDSAGNTWATCTVGPDDGGIPLEVGTYVMWVKITAVGSTPVKQGPTVTIV